MSIERLELTIRLDDHEWTITTEDCIRERLWFALAQHFKTRHGADKIYERLFKQLYQIEKSIEFASRHEDSMVEFEWLMYATAAALSAEEVKKP